MSNITTREQVDNRINYIKSSSGDIIDKQLDLDKLLSDANDDGVSVSLRNYIKEKVSIAKQELATLELLNASGGSSVGVSASYPLTSAGAIAALVDFGLNGSYFANVAGQTVFQNAFGHLNPQQQAVVRNMVMTPPAQGQGLNVFQQIMATGAAVAIGAEAVGRALIGVAKDKLSRTATISLVDTEGQARGLLHVNKGDNRIIYVSADGQQISDDIIAQIKKNGYSDIRNVTDYGGIVSYDQAQSKNLLNIGGSTSDRSIATVLLSRGLDGSGENGIEKIVALLKQAEKEKAFEVIKGKILADIAKGSSKGELIGGYVQKRGNQLNPTLEPLVSLVGVDLFARSLGSVGSSIESIIKEEISKGPKQDDFVSRMDQAGVGTGRGIVS